MQDENELMKKKFPVILVVRGIKFFFLRFHDFPFGYRRGVENGKRREIK